jgi:hypothetical protein
MGWYEAWREIESWGDPALVPDDYRRAALADVPRFHRKAIWDRAVNKFENEQRLRLDRQIAASGAR